MRNTWQKKTSIYLGAAAALSASFSVHAAGLGQLTVLSALGQPLRAEIDILSLQPDEADQLQVRLAAPEYYERAGVEYSTLLGAMRFRVERRADGRTTIEVRSSVPINEPYVDMLVQLDSRSGPLIRRFTFLLDPVEYVARTGGPGSASSSLAVHAEGEESAISGGETNRAAPIETRGGPAAAQVSGRRTMEAATPQAAVLPRGPLPAAAATAALDPSGITSYQVKPGDSLGEIASLLRSPGMPAARMKQAIFTMNPAAFIHQDMNLLRAGAVLSIPAGAPAVEQSPALPVSAMPPVNAVSSAFTPSPAKRADREYEAALAEVAALEEKVARVKEQLRQVDEEIARLQGTAPPAQAPGETPVAAAPTQAPGATPVAAAPAPAQPEGAALPSRPAVAAAAQPARVPSPPAQPKSAEAGWFDSLPDLPLLPLAGAGALLLGALGLWWYRRQRKAPTASREASVAAESSVQDAAPAADAQTSMASSISLQATDFSQSGIGEIDTEDIDPVAEADVYMAYGRDAQAEEILKEALRKDPGRDAVNLKLLEIYAGRNDVTAFNALASTLFTKTGGTGEDWDRAAALGRDLDPDNALYRNAGAPRRAVERTVPVARQQTAGDAETEAHARPAPGGEGQPHGDDIPVVADVASVMEPGVDEGRHGTADAALPAQAVPEHLDFDLSLEEAAPTHEPPSHFDLELPATMGPEAAAEQAGGKAPHLAMTSKLQLAEAYRDIGDHQGARELLDQVMSRGNSAQREHAQKLLEEISA